MPLGLKLFWGTVGVALAAFVVRTLFWPGSLSGLFDTGISSFLLAAGAVSCLLRAALVRRAGRRGWSRDSGWPPGPSATPTGR